jgi:PAS domain-containing protein
MSEQGIINPADGRIREIRAFPIKDIHGHVVYVVEYVRDITDRKRIAESLQESEEKYPYCSRRCKRGYRYSMRREI